MVESELRKQIARFKTLPMGNREWGDKENPGLGIELLNALWKQADDNEHARKVVDRLMETCKFCPTPAEVIECAKYLREAAKPEWSPEWRDSDKATLCASCSGLGSIEQSAGVYVRCACNNGTALEQSLLDLMNRPNERREPRKAMTEVEREEYDLTLLKAVSKARQG